MSTILNVAQSLKRRLFGLSPEDAQLERQDFVDNAIHALLEELADMVIQWDVSLLGAVRDIISDEFESRGIMTEADFYPCPDEPDEQEPCMCSNHDSLRIDHASTSTITQQEHSILAHYWLERFADDEMSFFLYGQGEHADLQSAILAYDRYIFHSSFLTDEQQGEVTWRADLALRNRHGDSYEVFKTIGLPFRKLPICQAAIKRCFCSLVVLQIGSSPESVDWNLCLVTAARELESCEDEVPAVLVDTLRLSDNKTFGYVAQCVAVYVAEQCPEWTNKYAGALTTRLAERE